MNMIKKLFRTDDYQSFDTLKDIERVRLGYINGIYVFNPPKSMIKLDIQPLQGNDHSFMLREEPVIHLYPYNGMLDQPISVGYYRGEDNIWRCERHGENFQNPPFVKIIDNKSLKNINNIGEILEQTTYVMEESYQRNTPLNPYMHFGIRLIDKIEPDYHGDGELVLVSKHFLKRNIMKDGAWNSHYFSDVFLEAFMKQNFKGTIENSEKLKEKIHYFNEQIITDFTKHYK